MNYALALITLLFSTSAFSNVLKIFNHNIIVVEGVGQNIPKDTWSDMEKNSLAAGGAVKIIFSNSKADMISGVGLSDMIHRLQKKTKVICILAGYVSEGAALAYASCPNKLALSGMGLYFRSPTPDETTRKLYYAKVATFFPNLTELQIATGMFFFSRQLSRLANEQIPVFSTLQVVKKKT